VTDDGSAPAGLRQISSLLVAGIALVLVLGAWFPGRNHVSPYRTLPDVDSVWSSDIFDSFASYQTVAAVRGDVLYVAGEFDRGDAVLIAFDKLNGDELWRTEFPAIYPRLLHIDADLLVVQQGERSASVFSVSDGRLLWEAPHGIYDVVQSPAGLHLMGFFNRGPGDSADVITVEPVTGEVLWKWDAVGIALYDHEYIAQGDTLYLNTTSRLVALNIESGQRQWKVDFAEVAEPDEEDYQGGTHISGSLGVALDADGELVGFDPDSGEVLWRQLFPATGGAGNVSLIHADSEALIFSDSSGVRSVSLVGEELWHVDEVGGCWVFPVTVVDGLVIAETQGGASMAFDAKSGAITWISAIHVRSDETWAESSGRRLVLSDNFLKIVNRDSGQALLSLPISRSEGRDHGSAHPVLDGELIYTFAEDGAITAFRLDDLLTAGEQDPTQGLPSSAEISCQDS